MKRCVVVCPGRGSYSKNCLGSLKEINSSNLDTLDAFRKSLDRPSVRELDASEKFRSSWHIAGENASILTAGASAADFDQIDDSYEIVAVSGNSMGWYTTLGLAGALDISEMGRLIETMGQYQKGNIIGGQLVYSLMDEHWHIDPVREQLVNEVIQATPDLYWSIKLGGQVILGGTTEALDLAIERLPTIDGPHPFPFKLPLHSAFHTPLMMGTHRQALRELHDLQITQPQVPMIDGNGHIWRPQACSTQRLLDYTLGKQVVDVYDFSAMIKTALQHFAPDHIILLGPGSNLGGAIAQVMIDVQWQGIQNKSDFLQRQQLNPFVLSMGRPEQRSLVTKQSR